MKKWMCLFFCLLSMWVRGQDYSDRIYQAYVTGRMERWKAVMEEMDRAYMADRDGALLYRLTEAEYGYIGYCIGEGRKAEARQLLEKAGKHVDILLKAGRDLPKVYGLQGAFYGFRVGLEPLKAPFYGRKSVEANEKAIKLGPDEPQVWMEKAHIEFYKPAIFGGSKKRAVPLYEKAVRLFETMPGRTEKNWIYLNSLVALAIAYEATGAIQSADRIYGKLLELEPSLVWIRDEVYPDFLEKHSLK
ncbi:MAG TPA: hypothetical protein ENO20_11935 [Bacteroides sp.]|nr:hypothetical protein [Bacteroides sp.]